MSIAGILPNTMGDLSLAYDLLGGEYGPLHMLTRVATYGLYHRAAFGPAFGLVAGLGLCFSLGLEFARAGSAPRPTGVETAGAIG